jgi:hypothetical protein
VKTLRCEEAIERPASRLSFLGAHSGCSGRRRRASYRAQHFGQQGSVDVRRHAQHRSGKTDFDIRRDRHRWSIDLGDDRHQAGRRRSCCLRLNVGRVAAGRAPPCEYLHRRAQFTQLILGGRSAISCRFVMCDACFLAGNVALRFLHLNRRERGYPLTGSTSISAATQWRRVRTLGRKLNPLEECLFR